MASSSGDQGKGKHHDKDVKKVAGTGLCFEQTRSGSTTTCNNGIHGRRGKKSIVMTHIQTDLFQFFKRGHRTFDIIRQGPDAKFLKIL